MIKKFILTMNKEFKTDNEISFSYYGGKSFFSYGLHMIYRPINEF